MTIQFEIVSAIVGLVIGAITALAGGYLVFQTKQTCQDIRTECVARYKDFHSAESEALSEIKTLLVKMQCEITKQQKMLMSIIVALPVDETVKRDILKT